MTEAADSPRGRACALWLLPESSAGRALAGLIRELARRFDTPEFEPHVTLLGAMPCTAELHHCLGRLPATGPLALRVQGLESGTPPFRALYLRLDTHAGLERLRTGASEGCPHREAQPWFPHLSLLYGDLAPAVRSRLAGELAPRLPGQVLLDRIAAVDARGPVAAWQVLDARPLA